jgi:hypothetical protein
MSAFAMLAVLSVGTPAYALDQEIQVTIDGSEHTFSAANGAVNTGGTFSNDGVTITVSSTSNSPGTQPLSDLLGSTLSLSSTGGTHNVTISTGDTNFTLPHTPPNILVDSHLGGTVLAANSGATLSFQSYVDPANGQNSTAGGLGTQTTYASGNINAKGSFALTDKTATLTSLTTTFSLTSVATLHFTGATTLNYTTSLGLTQVAPVPEPSTMAIAGLGGLGLVGYGLRRRKALGV